ncbi:MAG: DUF6212 domain-containing protein [Anaerolineales bacterium]|nr:DUF6212 domain-containing protein [Anaerolineales bacterium]
MQKKSVSQGQTRRVLRNVLSLALLLLFSTGCSSLPVDLSGAGQSKHSLPPILLSPDHSFGQTFTTRQAGLNGIDVFLSPQAGSRGNLILELYSSPQLSSLLAKSSISIDAIHNSGWVRFYFNSPVAQKSSDLFFILRLDGSGEVGVGVSSGASYVDGSAYQDGQPLQDNQLAFRLVYAGSAALWGLAGEIVTWLLWLGLAVTLFVLPGWVLLGSTWSNWTNLFFEERLGLAIGISLALYPPLFLWTDLVGWHLGWFYAVLPTCIALFFLILRGIQNIRSKKPWFAPGISLKAKELPILAALVVTAGLLFGVRFYVVRNLSLPLWGDSLQHTIITRLIMDNNGLFQSWQPYAEMTSLTYHFGFHSLSAVFAWVSGMSAEQVIIWFGQILNGGAVLAILPLIFLFTRNRWAGVFGVIIAGLLAPMPMFYVNWGRYTQLAGQAIFPFIAYMSYSTLKSKHNDRSALILTGLAFGGLALTHYRILILAILFLVAIVIFSEFKNIKPRLINVFYIGSIGGLLFLPWLIHIYRGAILANFRSQLTTPANMIPTFTEQYNSVGMLTDYLPAWMWLLLGLVIAWGLWRREVAVAIFGSWLVMVLLVANPRIFNLPGTGAINNFAILIAAYIPAGILGGAAVGWATQKIFTDHLPTLSLILLFIAVSLGIVGAKQRITDLQPSRYSLATRADIRAADWIRTNLPADSYFLVNSFLAYGNSISAGSDGGWWLRYLSSRQTTLPPLLYSSETGPFPEYALSINALTSLIHEKGVTSSEMIAELARQGVNYVYVGQTQGRTGFGGPYPMEPSNFLASPNYQLVYHQDRVWVFKILFSEDK